MDKCWPEARILTSHWAIHWPHGTPVAAEYCQWRLFVLAPLNQHNLYQNRTTVSYYREGVKVWLSFANKTIEPFHPPLQPATTFSATTFVMGVTGVQAFPPNDHPSPLSTTQRRKCKVGYTLHSGFLFSSSFRSHVTDAKSLKLMSEAGAPIQ